MNGQTQICVRIKQPGLRTCDGIICDSASQSSHPQLLAMQHVRKHLTDNFMLEGVRRSGCVCMMTVFIFINKVVQM